MNQVEIRSHNNYLWKAGKILLYRTLMSYVRNIQLGDILPLQMLAEKISEESVPEVYRLLKPFVMRLADMYLCPNEKTPAYSGLMGKNSTVCGMGG